MSMSAPAPQMAVNGTPIPRGPIVRVTRGKDTQDVALGGK